VDEWQIRIDFRGAAQHLDARQAGLGQYPGDRVTVHAQLLGDGSDPPALSMVIAQDLRLDVRGNGHGDVLFDRSTSLGSAAESHGERAVDSDGRSDDSTIAAGSLCPSAIVPPGPLPDPRPTDHPIDPARNPDASRYFCASGGGVIAPHD
jgi:hypothetical protein